MRELLQGALIFFVLISACKEPEPINFDPVPTISYKSISPKIVNEFTDSVIIQFTYRDGDGDLGHKNPDINLLSVHDARLKNADAYYVPPLAPIGSNIPIDGILTIRLRNTWLLGSGADETTSYTVKMQDRAGNWSNAFVTEPITITR